MRFVFLKEFPTFSEFHYIHYSGRRSSQNPTGSLDVQPLAERYFPAWRKEVLNWHSRLCKLMQENVANWYAFYASRLLIWQPPILKPLFFTLAVKKFLKENPIEDDVLYIVGAPEETAHYFAQVFPDTPVSTQPWVSLWDQMKIPLRRIFFIVQLLFRGLMGQSLHRLNWKKKTTLIYSQINKAAVFLKSEDHFFGSMFDGHNEENFWLVNGNTLKGPEKVAIANKFKQEGKEGIILQDYFSLRDFFPFLWEAHQSYWSVQGIKSRLPLLEIDGESFPIFNKIYFHRIIATYIPFDEIELSLTLKRIFSHQTFKRLIYPYEEKGLERVLLSQFHSVGGKQSLAYAHAIHHEGHTVFCWDDYTEVDIPRPSQVLTTGEGSSKFLSEFYDVPGNRLVSVGTKRNATLEDAPSREKVKNILVLIGQGHELTRLANIIHDDPKIFEGFNLLIRKYPFDEHEEQDAAIKLIEESGQEVIQNNKSLSGQLAESDLAIFASTSAGYEAILGGTLGLYLNLHQLIPLDSVSRKGAPPEMFVCRQVDELKKTLKKLSTMNEEELLKLWQTQRDFAASVYSPLNFSKIGELYES